MKDFDFIIVGAGSAGCVLARRLTDDPRRTVLLIEAGPEPTSLISMPLGFGRTLTDPRLAWHYPTEPEYGTGGNSRIWLRGKTLGGSSAVNGMVYCRGQPQDYDDWAAAGATGWDWNTFLAAFKAIEDHELGADPFRGAGGPLPISIQRHRSAVTEAVLHSCHSLGTPVKIDINRPDQEGVGYSPVTIKDGRRMSSYEAFLKPVRQRSNLRILTDRVVSRVLIEQGRAIGVELLDGEGTCSLRARREVILSAGTIGSPKILQLSGIGPGAHLRSLGLQVHLDCAAGSNLSEHKAVWLECRLNRRFGHNEQLRGWRLGLNALRYLLFKTGTLATTVDINGFIRTTPDLDRPDAQICFWSLTAKKNAATLETEPFSAINAGGWHLRPKSRGSILIRSADPHDSPVIRPNFLTHEEDRRVLIGTFRYLRSVFRHPELAAFVAEETLPGAGIDSDEEIIGACLNGENGFHATGTCRMGSDPASVVDPRLRVRGIQGLRVIDCSVMPTQVSSGVNGPVMALAWHAAALVGEDHPG